MPLIFAPRQFQLRADFYQQLAQVLTAGITLVSALEMLEQNPGCRADQPCLRRVLGALRDGSTFSEALARTGRWLPMFDLALLHAGEQSGRLPECFRLLGSHYAERAQLARQTLADLAYPVCLLHLAVFIFPFPELFASGNVPAYLGKTLGILVPLYLVVLAGIYALQARHGERWRGLLERLLHRVPLLGSARRSLALARLAASLEALLSAGVTVIEAWEIAALACGSPALCAAVAGWTESLRAGQTPAEAVRRSPAFPEMFASLYQTGEVSGKLDESLHNLSRYYMEEGTRKLRLLAQWSPRLFYFAVVLLVAARVVMFWMGYFNQLSEVIKAVP
jgi:type II secretory pathway component PulF